MMHKYFIALMTAVVGLMTVTPLMARGNVSFHLKDAKVTRSMRSGGAVEVQLDVKLSKHMHIKIKQKSALSRSKVTSFRVSSKGWDTAVIKSPAGETRAYDQVLMGRGTRKIAGTYKLKIFETLGRAPRRSPHKLRLVISTQLCNNRTGHCARMRTKRVRVSIRISGKKTIVRSRASSNIRWVTRAEAAYKKARKNGRNLFVIITAPSWCGYCIYMEKNTFPNKEVEKVLNKKFVPLRLVWGKRPPPDLRKFVGGGSVGLPTMLIYSKDGKRLAKLERRGSVRVAGLLRALKPFEKTGGGGKVSSQSFVFEDATIGSFTGLGGVKWRAKTLEGEKSYTETKRDKNFIIVKNDRSGVYVALPLVGGTGYVYRRGKWVAFPAGREKN